MNDDPFMRRLIQQLAEFQRAMAPSIEAARKAVEQVEGLRPTFDEAARNALAQAESVRPMLDAIRGFRLPTIDLPQLPDSTLAIDFGRLSADAQAQMSMFRDLGPTLARVLELQQSFLRGLKLPDLEALREGQQRLLRDAESLAKAGWTFSPDMSPAEIFELAKRANKPAAIDEWFVGYYDAERGQKFRALASRLTKRKRLGTWRALLREALWAYRRKRYRLVVPAMLATIEGLVCEVTGTIQEKGVNAHVNWDKRSSKPPEGFFVHVQWCATTAFLAGLWSRSDFGGPQPDNLNRHWVLHGRHPEIGGRADALRLLAAVDFIADAADRIDRLNKKLQKKKPKDRPPDGDA